MQENDFYKTGIVDEKLLEAMSDNVESLKTIYAGCKDAPQDVVQQTIQRIMLEYFAPIIKVLSHFENQSDD